MTQEHQYKYFSYKGDPKLACSCCGEQGLKHELMTKLDDLREAVGVPLHVTSGFRCAEFNAQVSSTGAAGPHTSGLAVDIQCSGKKAHAVLQEALALGFTGIGVKQKGSHSSRFIHLDLLEDGPRPWVWSY